MMSNGHRYVSLLCEAVILHVIKQIIDGILIAFKLFLINHLGMPTALAAGEVSLTNDAIALAFIKEVLHSKQQILTRLLSLSALGFGYIGEHIFNDFFTFQLHLLIFKIAHR